MLALSGGVVKVEELADSSLVALSGGKRGADGEAAIEGEGEGAVVIEERLLFSPQAVQTACPPKKSIEPPNMAPIKMPYAFHSFNLSSWLLICLISYKVIWAIEQNLPEY